MARILLVDDDPDILNFGRKVLSSVDHEVIVAAEATRALEYLNTYDFNLVISDANMPFMNGFEFIKSIRANPDWRSTPVALLTARREKNDVRQALQVGANDYIVKPIDPLVFLNKVEALLDQREEPESAEYQFRETDKNSVGQLQVDIQLLSISELGLSFLSHFQVDSGQTIEIEAPAFAEMGVPTPAMKVIGCQAIRNDLWKIRTVYCGTPDSVLQKIRAWMIKVTTKQHKKGA